jgi:hypothetical protein
VVAYQVSRLRQKGPCIIYQQHVRYMQIKEITGTPRELFSSDFVNAILRWIEHGDCIVLFVDANEHILTGKLPTALAKLVLQEATHALWGELELRTYVHGDGAPIDGVFHTPDIKVTAIMQLLFHEGVGDHCTTILDISTRLAIGKHEQRVVTPQARRLTNKNGASIRAYIKHVTKQSRRHKFQERFDCITTKLQSEPITPDDAKDMETLDIQKIEAQTGGKLRCRKIRKPALPFSPPIRNLDLQRGAYVNLCKWHKGDKLTNKHIFREAMRHDIDHSKELTAEQCAQGAAVCQKLLKEHKEDAEGLR